MRRELLIGAFASAVLGYTTEVAAEVAGIDDNLPVTIDDSGVSKPGEKEFEALVIYDRVRGSGGRRNEFTPQLGFEYGVLPGLELSFAISYSLGTSSDVKRGTISPGATYKLNDETPYIPAFALDAGISIPYGYGGDAVDASLTLLASKSLGSAEWAPRLHLNAGWIHRFDAADTERQDRYFIAAGMSKQVAKSWAIAADIVREQGEQKRTASNLVEAGLRPALSDKVVLSFGAGVGIGEESPVYRGILGLQYGF